MSEFFGNIAGNATLRVRLAAEIKSGTFPHAYIIEGQEGSGRRTLARSIAAALSCSNPDRLPCGVCPACRKIFGNKTPDVISVIPEQGRSSIGVEVARQIRRDVIVLPIDFAYKVYIIEEADKMTPEAQNALLLTLEEPPGFAVFLLICRSASDLLLTVRSRAPTVRTEPIASEVIADYLISHDNRAAKLKAESPGEFAELISAAGGCIGQALSLLDPDKRRPIMERRRLARSFVGILAAPDRSFAERLDIISMFSSRREEITEELRLIADALRDLILLKKTGQAQLVFWSDRAAALEVAGRFSLEELLLLFEQVDTAAGFIGRNANIRLTLTNLVFARTAVIRK
jgi:DNA polymerase-3 subunit delta'